MGKGIGGELAGTKHTYIYDGTIEGMFSAIFDGWTDKRIDKIVRSSSKIDKYDDTDRLNVVSCVSKYDRIRRWVVNTIGKSGMIKINRVYLTEQSGAEMAVFRYLKLAAVLGREVDNRTTHSAVMEINALERAYCNETHRMYGFVNFTELDNGILFASIGTRYNQLETLMDFYHGRMEGKKIIILDANRGSAAVCNGAAWKIIDDFPDESFGEDYSVRDHDSAWLKKLNELCEI